MNNKFLKEPWLKWAIEIQSIAQSGLTYTKDEYDKERYEQLRNIASEMLSYKTDIPVDKVKDLFCNESGYQTPKLDTRAVVFEEDKILSKYKDTDHFNKTFFMYIFLYLFHILLSVCGKLFFHFYC